MSLARRLAGLEEIGIGPDGAVTRLAWSEDAEACAEWFTGQAREVGLTAARDPAGNLWAVPGDPGPWWAAGSHLDSVRRGGRYDGPLGVACAFELAAQLEGRLAVISFADEEGARFNTPTFGSKALAGKLDLSAVLERRDADGVTIAQAMRGFGVDPEGMEAAPDWLRRLRGFLEIHIDQSTELQRAGAPVGVVSSLAHRMRLEVEVRGSADHAGTTPRGERHDALLEAARLIVWANEEGASVSRIDVEPNAATTIASRVRLWVDVRSPDPGDLDTFLARMRERAPELRIASRSEGTTFDPELRERLLLASGGEALPELVCFAGHDAGVLADRLPAAMLLVRNRTGVSHSPQEQVELDDAAVAVEVAARALKELV